MLAQSSFKFYDDISLPQTDAWNFVRQGEVSPSLYTGTINLSVRGRILESNKTYITTTKQISR